MTRPIELVIVDCDGVLVVSASEVANGKPAPDLFLQAAKQMGVDPAACAVVEDSRYGVEAARAANPVVRER